MKTADIFCLPHLACVGLRLPPACPRPASPKERPTSTQEQCGGLPPLFSMLVSVSQACRPMFCKIFPHCPLLSFHILTAPVQATITSHSENCGRFRLVYLTPVFPSLVLFSPLYLLYFLNVFFLNKLFNCVTVCLNSSRLPIVFNVKS